MLFVDLIQSTTYIEQFPSTRTMADYVKQPNQVVTFCQKISNQIPYYSHPQGDLRIAIRSWTPPEAFPTLAKL